MGCHTNNNMACLIIFVKPPKPLQRRPQPAGEHHPARASDRPQQSGRPAAPGSPRPRPADPPRESAVTRRRTRRRTPPRDLGKAEHSIGQRLASGATTGEGTQNLLWADLARRSADRPHPQRRLRPLVGRSRPRARHRRARHQRRPPSLARRRLLRDPTHRRRKQHRMRRRLLSLSHAHAAQRQNSVRLEPRAGLSGHGVAGGTQEKGPCPRSKHNGPHGRSFILSSPED